MEKVKITKDQLVALGHFRKNRCVLTDFLYGQENFAKEYLPLKTIQPEDFAKVLCGWYEVERPFEVGDWVYDEILNGYFKIVDYSNEETVFGEDKYYLNDKMWLSGHQIKNGKYKKVTEPWKINLLESGRKRPEFKVGDVIETENDIYIFQDYNKERVLAEVIKAFEKGTVEFIHPVESRIKVKSND